MTSFQAVFILFAFHLLAPSHQCPETIGVPGVIRPPGSVQSCTYTVSGDVLELSFDRFDVDSWFDDDTGECLGNRLIIREVDPIVTAAEFIIGTYCGRNAPSRIIPRGSSVVVEYVVVDVGQVDDFEIKVAAGFIEPEYIVVEYDFASRTSPKSSLVITSPNYPDQSPVNLWIQWLIIFSTDVGYVTVSEYQLEHSCSTAYFEYETILGDAKLCDTTDTEPRVLLADMQYYMTLRNVDKPNVKLRLEAVEELPSTGDFMTYDCRRPGANCLNGNCDLQTGKCECPEEYSNYDCGFKKDTQVVGTRCQCLHGGSCYQSTRADPPKCHCTERYTGDYCEYERILIDKCSTEGIQLTVTPHGTFDKGKAAVVKARLKGVENATDIDTMCSFVPHPGGRPGSFTVHLERVECLNEFLDQNQRDTIFEAIAFLSYDDKVVGDLDQFIRIQCIFQSRDKITANAKIVIEEIGVGNVPSTSREQRTGSISLAIVNNLGEALDPETKHSIGDVIKIVATLAGQEAGEDTDFVIEDCTAETEDGLIKRTIIENNQAVPQSKHVVKSITCSDTKVEFELYAFKFQAGNQVKISCNFHICASKQGGLTSCPTTCDEPTTTTTTTTTTDPERHARRARRVPRSVHAASKTIFVNEEAQLSTHAADPYRPLFVGAASVVLLLAVAVTTLFVKLQSNRRAVHLRDV